MKTFRFFIDTGFAGCEHEMFVSFDDDVKQETLEEYAQDFLQEMIYVGWEESEE